MIMPSVLLPPQWTVEDHLIPLWNTFPLRFVEEDQMMHWPSDSYALLQRDIIFDISIQNALHINWLNLLRYYIDFKSLNWSAHRIEEIFTALHEALANNILWANLDLKEIWNRQENPFSLQEIIHKRFENPLYQKKPLRVCFDMKKNVLTCFIEHKGQAFIFDPSDARPAYKGTSIINTLANHVETAANGQGLILTFEQKSCSHAS
jgi:hypothetical protein